MNEVAKRETVERMPDRSGVLTPMEMVSQAVASGASLEMVERLLGLQERYEAGQARKAFNEAFAAFKAEAVSVVRNRKVDEGPLKGRRYAELFSFVDAATPALSKHGLSASWKITRDEKDWIEVTCIIEHEFGGRKEVALGGPPDTGGAKNPLQARISTVTYLERATFKAACGLAEQGDDDDGKGGGKPDNGPLSADQFRDLRRLFEETGRSEDKFCAYYKIDGLEELPARLFDNARATILTAAHKEAKKQEVKPDA